MLHVIKNINTKGASDLNNFLRDVLVEVAGENYRQTMYEAMALRSTNANTNGRGIQYDLDPPLRANERVLSGLFATAISKVALRSRTEVRIDRPERDANIDALEHDLAGDGTPSTKNGRVDYLAWYSRHVIGIELKMASINCETAKATESIKNRWSVAVNQAKTVQTCLRARSKEDEIRYPKPISMALMVIVGRRSIRTDDFEAVNDGIEEMEASTLSTLAGLTPRPSFMASYTFPTEFRALTPRRKGKEAPKDGRAIYTPFILFIAKPSVNSIYG